MYNVSGNGTIVTIRTSFTFPTGIVLSAWADDADPVDIPTVIIGEAKKGVNGDLITYSVPNGIPATIRVIPGSLEDRLLNILLQANMPGKFKINARDVVSMNVVYPNATFIFLTTGIMISGMPASSVASSSRLKTKEYAFAFENYTSG